MGFPVIDDPNGPMRAGAGYINMNIAADGTRVSSSRAFLRPNLERPNLTLCSTPTSPKSSSAAIGRAVWSLCTGDGAKTIRAMREVVLAAGTIHSAKPLMLSGVGDARATAQARHKADRESTGVGRNLQDHSVLVSGVVYQYKGKMPDRPADSNAVEAEVYLSSGVDSYPTDINLVLEQLPIATPEAAARFGAPPKDGFTIAPSAHPADQPRPCAAGQRELALMRRSLKAIISARIAISPPSCGRSRRPASSAARLRSMASEKRRSFQGPKRQVGGI